MINTENLMEIQLSLSSPTYRGPKGEKPIKGVDYFTQEDINDIVSQIEIGEISLAGYASKEYVDEAVSGVVVEETDPTVPQWAKQSTKPSYTASEVGALPADTPLFSGSYNDLTNKPTLFSGSYNDLTNKPSLFSGNYNDLTNKPTIPTVPVNISAFTNDAGYLTSHQSLTGYATESYVDNAIANIELPDGGILVETDPTVPSWAKQASKPTYTAQEVGALPANTALFSGDYNDLSNKPTIPVVPTNVSSFTNDAGYLTTHQSLTDYATKSYVETAIRGAESGLLKRSVVQALPVSDIDEDTIYMVAKTGSTGDVYDEYLYVNSNWEHIGSTDVDLTDYRKTYSFSAGTTLTQEQIDILAEFYTLVDGNTYQTIRDLPYQLYINNLPVFSVWSNGANNLRFYTVNLSPTTFGNSITFPATQYYYTFNKNSNGEYPTQLTQQFSYLESNGLYITGNSTMDGNGEQQIGQAFLHIKNNYAKLTDIPTVPSNVSAFTNDAGYLTSHQSLSGYATQSYVDTAIANIPSSGSTPIDFEDGYWGEDNGTYSLDVLAISDYCFENNDITTDMIYTNEMDETTGDTILLEDKLAQIDQALITIPNIDILRVPLNTVFSNDNEVAQKLSTFNTALNNHTQKPNYMIVLYDSQNDYQVVHYEGDSSLPFPVLWTLQNTQDGFRVFLHQYNGNSGYTINGGYEKSNYTLPIATTSTLGGVKVDGTTITISNGVISATPSGSSYTLPTASTSTLGGVKVDGSTITIDANGVISSSASGGSSYTAGQGISIDNGEISVDFGNEIENGSFSFTQHYDNEDYYEYTSYMYPDGINLTSYGEADPETGDQETKSISITGEGITFDDTGDTHTLGVSNGELVFDDSPIGSGGGSSYTAGNGIDIDANNVISANRIDSSVPLWLALLGISSDWAYFSSQVVQIGNNDTQEKFLTGLLNGKIVYTYVNVYWNGLGTTLYNLGYTKVITLNNNGSIQETTITENIPNWRPDRKYDYWLCGKVIMRVPHTNYNDNFGVGLGKNLPYDNTTSGLTASTIKGAIDEVVSNMDTRIPTAPTTDGDYVLKVSVSSGTPTYSWVSAT